ncbi:hypothetical protein ETF27_08585 [Prevotella brunnea]|uniref:Uncharacterized protein n=1 Tax=Prevotella brunnea TaxID=2508867 RepID=A0A5C8GE42_9BACT|nr:hypothetical protein ETF27_08585 [Prevotella brunnea]
MQFRCVLFPGWERIVPTGGLHCSANGILLFRQWNLVAPLTELHDSLRRLRFGCSEMADNHAVGHGYGKDYTHYYTMKT